jgi:hypothetical protein
MKTKCDSSIVYGAFRWRCGGLAPTQKTLGNPSLCTIGPFHARIQHTAFVLGPFTETIVTLENPRGWKYPKKGCNYSCSKSPLPC